MNPHAFALARFTRLLKRQEADLLAFDSNGISIHAADQIIRQIAWKEVKKIELDHINLNLSPIGNMISSSLISRRECKIFITLETEVLEWWLEYDVQYRPALLINWLQDLYEAGLPISEHDANGRKTYLLKAVTG